jgi:hypothetical protein
VISDLALLVLRLRKVVAVIDDQRCHVLMISEVGKKLGRDEEVLTAILCAGHLDQLIVYGALVFHVHALCLHQYKVVPTASMGGKWRRKCVIPHLIDLIDQCKWRLRQPGKAHQIQNGRQTPLPTTLPLASEQLQGLIRAELDKDFDAPFRIVFLILCNAYFSGAMDAIESCRESSVHFVDKLIEFWLPFRLDRGYGSLDGCFAVLSVLYGTLQMLNLVVLAV